MPTTPAGQTGEPERQPVRSPPAGPGPTGRAVIFATVAGSWAIALGVVVLVDWVAGRHLIDSMAPGSDRMRPAAALAIAALGVGVVGLARHAHRTVWAASALGASLSAASVGEHLTGVDLGDHAWLFVETVPLPSAVTSVVMAASLLLTERGWYRASQLSASLSLLASALATVSHLYGIQEHGPGWGEGVTAHGALTVVALSVATLGLTAGRGYLAVPIPPPADVVVRRLLPGTLAVLVAVTLMEQLGERAGWYPPPIGSALIATVGSALITVVVVRTARELAALEDQRAAAVRSLRALNETLDEQVRARTADLVAQGRRRERAEQLVDALFESVPDHLCVVDEEEHVVRLNPQWARTLGWTMDELAAHPLRELMHPEDREHFHRRQDELRRPGTTILNCPSRMRCHDGTYRWLSWNARRAAPNLFVAAARDITERLEAERFRERAARRNEILARISRAFARAGPDLEGIAGELVTELLATVGDRVALYLLSEDRTTLHPLAASPGGPGAPRARPEPAAGDGPLQQAFREAATVLSPAPGERDTDGPEIPAALSALWLPLRRGKEVMGVLHVARRAPATPFSRSEVTLCTEVAERAALALAGAQLFAAKDRAEATARAREAQFRAIFDNVPLGAVTTSLRPEDLGRFLEVNEAYCQLSGYRRDQLLGMTVFDVTLMDPAVLRAGADRLRRGAPPVAVEVQDRLADGKVIEVRVVTAAMTQPGGADVAVSLVEDVTARKQLERELTRRALYDEVTGLANRYLLMDRIGLALDQQRRGGADTVLVYLDVDRFKELNDSYGHHAGDHVLRTIGERLRSAVRTIDTAARLAGDEFVVLFPNVEGRDTVDHLVERIRAAVAQPVDLDGHRLMIGASLGIAVAEPAMGVDDLLRAADAAMYQAKRRGRGRWVIHRGGLPVGTKRHDEIERQLGDAVERGALRLHYQPVIDLTAERIVGTEALLRLEHPTRGLLPPAEFIDIAEDHDLIVPIGAWVLSQACRQAAEWTRRFGPLEMAINVSGRQLAHPEIVEHLHAALAGAALSPEQLCVEMSERVLIDEGDQVAGEIEQLAVTGVRLALDHVGAGRRSLAHLDRLPITRVKIDRDVVAGIAQHPGDAAFVHAVSTLADDLDLITTATGVERADQLGRLRTLRCERAQGFLFYRPQPPDAIARVLQHALDHHELLAPAPDRASRRCR